MHLKFFLVIAKDNKNYALSPAYDMVVVSLVLPKDLVGLNLNGKKRKLKLKRQDFNESMAKPHIPTKAIENLWKRIEKGMQNWNELINNSFLSDENKNALKELIENKANQLEFHLGW
jgi:serine/threonine-protein kinase HipA